MRASRTRKWFLSLTACGRSVEKVILYFVHCIGICTCGKRSFELRVRERPYCPFPTDVTRFKFYILTTINSLLRRVYRFQMYPTTGCIVNIFFFKNIISFLLLISFLYKCIIKKLNTKSMDSSQCIWNFWILLP